MLHILSVGNPEIEWYTIRYQGKHLGYVNRKMKFNGPGNTWGWYDSYEYCSESLLRGDGYPSCEDAALALAQEVCGVVLGSSDIAPSHQDFVDVLDGILINDEIQFYDRGSIRFGKIVGMDKSNPHGLAYCIYWIRPDGTEEITRRKRSDIL